MNGKHLFAFASLTFVTQYACAEFVISPNFPSTGFGAPEPFFVSPSQASSYRLQEVHRATDFQHLNSPLLITEFSLGRSSGSLPIDVTLPNVAIRFSTTAGIPHELSGTFAENIGADETTVFSGPLRLVDTGGPFGLSIPLETPFYYDPRRGNLLMDIWNYSTIPRPPNGGYGINWQGTFSPSVSGVSANSTTATQGFTYDGGMIARFTVTPVPEPSTWLLLATGVATLAFVRRRWNR